MKTNKSKYSTTPGWVVYALIAALVLMLGSAYHIRSNQVFNEDNLLEEIDSSLEGFDEKEQEDHLPIYFIFNIVCAILATIIAFYHYENADYFDALKEDKKAKRNWAKATDELYKMKRIASKEENEAKAIKERKAQEYIEEESQKLTDQIQEYEKAIVSLNSFIRHQIIRPVKGAYKDDVDMLRSSFNDILKEAMKEPIEFGPHKPLDFDDEDNPLLPEGSGSSDEYPFMGTKNGKSGKTNLTTAIIFFLGLGLWGCQQVPSPEPASKIGVVILDGSSSSETAQAEPSTVEQISVLLDMLEYNFRNTREMSRDEVKVIISSIGTTSFPPTFEVKLEKAVGSIVKVKRIKEQNVFIAKLRREIDKVSGTRDLGQSYVQSCLCQTLPLLATAEAERKAVLIVSDMIQYNPQVSLDFYRMDLDRRYDRIAEMMDKQCSSMRDMRLDGTVIKIVYSPDAATDLTANRTRVFWQNYLGSKGANVQFVANLPRIGN